MNLGYETGTGSLYPVTSANREALGLFNSIEKLQDAVRELEATAFPRDSISILGHRKTLEDRFGAAEPHPYTAEDDRDAPREAPVRPEEQTIGATVLVGCGAYIGVVAAGLALGPATLPVTLMAIVLGGGSGAALAGALISRIKHHHDQQVQDQVAQGGLLLWVRTPDAEKERLACEILERHGAHDVHVHDMPL